MAKKVTDDILDAALDQIALCTNMDVCSSEPADPTGITAASLATVVLTAGDGNGDYTIANGDTSGRKITVAQQASISITGSGTATHVVLSSGDLVSSTMHVTTCTSQALTAGGTVTVPAYDASEIADPA